MNFSAYTIRYLGTIFQIPYSILMGILLSLILVPLLSIDVGNGASTDTFCYDIYVWVQKRMYIEKCVYINSLECEYMSLCKVVRVYRPTARGQQKADLSRETRRLFALLIISSH